MSDIPEGDIHIGDEIVYGITVKNISELNTIATVQDILPEEMEFIELYYNKNGEKIVIDSDNLDIQFMDLYLKAGEEFTLYLRAKAKEIDKKSVEITNRVIVNGQKIKDIEANRITHRIIGKEIVPSEKYSISGVAWFDTNKNGKRDLGENLQEGIDVLLLDSATSNVISKAKTDKKGMYEFTELEQGNYVVAFQYDTTKYDVTIYKAEDIDESLNSDVVNMNVTINGATGIYATTDRITVNENVHNIDIGLITKPVFDMALSKSVSLIQLNTKSGNKNYKFENVSIAKIEIPEKELNGAQVSITYTFTVENKGDTPGYVNKIVDYLSKDLSFNDNLNPDWEKDTNGNLYNTSISNRIINPNEKIEVTLILTKTMNEENLGIFNNSAEIAESSNDKGLSDVNSKPGNKAVNENDYGTADVIITLKTGGPILYIALSIAIIGIFTFGVYEIKKRVLV